MEEEPKALLRKQANWKPVQEFSQRHPRGNHAYRKNRVVCTKLLPMCLKMMMKTMTSPIPSWRTPSLLTVLLCVGFCFCVLSASASYRFAVLIDGDN
jgi:hypothetical protein